ncbi:hypothetical protein FNW02_13185 [Komarekiella sp. 'clone 1']|uniref:Uncharacterized protein n=1 Tax=Komarekiella delphini-convector SJRDD-AB1 TaxID=2593771 RepID=A0AA40VR49_9NOST|nr:hypothetical protein [Komarekiella delphini-convector]MBD6616755.1 hypothetical protein [Komarekiella delphini-convector SJRDD-AB1]
MVLGQKPTQNFYFAYVEVVEVNLTNPFDSVSFCISHSNSPALMIMAAVIGNSVSNFLIIQFHATVITCFLEVLNDY